MLRRATHDKIKNVVFAADQLRVKTNRTMLGGAAAGA